MINVLCAHCDQIFQAREAVSPPTPVKLPDKFAATLLVPLMSCPPTACPRCGFVNRLFLGHHLGSLDEVPDA